MKKIFNIIVNKNVNSKNSEIKRLQVQRGETQKNVNNRILECLVNKFKRDSSLNVLDLPCGNMFFLKYIRLLFPKANLLGIDIKDKSPQEDIRFTRMDLTEDFLLPKEEQYDLITSISGIMMFDNTLRFIKNCVIKLKENGVFIISNDNSATIIDKLAFLFLGRYRIFNTLFEDSLEMTRIVPIQELCHLLRTNGLTIEKIEYTSFYKKDLKYVPFALFTFPIQLIYLLQYKTELPSYLKWQMYPFKHYFCKHYFIVAKKN